MSGIKKTDEIYDDMLRRIVDWELLPGDLVSETATAEYYGVSRTVIRGIFLKLEMMGLMEVLPQRGTFVTKVNLNYVDDISTLRKAVESYIFREVVTKLNDEELRQLVTSLKDNLARQKQYYVKEKTLLTKEMSKAFSVLDREFHFTIMHSVKRDLVFELLSQQMNHLYRWRNYLLTARKPLARILEDHKNIVEAIENRDIEHGIKYISEHISKVDPFVDRALSKHPEYFIW